MACQTEINGLPVLSGCPADTELLLVMNSTAAGNNGGYGIRYVSEVRQCWLVNNLTATFFDFVIGNVGSPLAVGASSFTVNQANVIEDSVWVSLDGQELPRNDNTQISYTIVYNGDSGFTITFNQGAINQQQYIIHYTYAT